MNKVYITPSTEVETIQVNAIMALSLTITDGAEGDVADSRKEIDIWNDVEE